jgi:hypothetical protein
MESSHTYEFDLSQTRKKETEQRHAAERRDLVLKDVIALEVKLGIANRWQPSDAPYIETAKYISMRKYHRALDNLQRLVVQRLFELHKLNLSQSGAITPNL